MLRIDSAASIECQGNVTCFMYFPRSALEAALLTSTSCFLFARGRNKLCLSYMLLMIGWTKINNKASSINKCNV
jgi:hypothetical protein